MLAGQSFIKIEYRRLEKQPAPTRHGIARVGGEIYHDLVELPGIHLDDGVQRSRQMQDFDIIAHEWGQQLAHLFEPFVQVEDLGLDGLAAAEGEKLAGQGCTSLGCLADVLYELDPFSVHLVAQQF